MNKRRISAKRQTEEEPRRYSELKNITELKNSLQGFNSRLDQAEKRIKSKNRQMGHQILKLLGVPTVAQWDQGRLCSSRMQVGSLAWQ